MKTLQDFDLVADANLRPEVVSYLRERGFNVLFVSETEMFNWADTKILDYANEYGKVVITHDRDFGNLVYRDQQKFIGVVYLRPGHIDPNETIKNLNAFLSLNIEVVSPFIVVIESNAEKLKIRVRNLR